MEQKIAIIQEIIYWNLCRSRLIRIKPTKVKSILRKIYLLMITFKNSKLILSILFNKNFYVMYQVDLVITTKCTLKCKGCSNLMPYYHSPYNIDKSLIIRSIDNLFSTIDYVNIVYIIGGEPFVSPENIKVTLKELLKHINQINEIHFFTNGTIIPKDAELIQLMKSSKKISILLSDYEQLSINKNSILEFAYKANIRIYDLQVQEWFDFGNLDKRNRSTDELSKQFSRCSILCRSILNGKLFYCPRAAHGSDLGFIPEHNYINLLEENISREQLRESIHTFLNRDAYIDSCDYCDRGAKELSIIKPATQ